MSNSLLPLRACRSARPRRRLAMAARQISIPRALLHLLVSRQMCRCRRDLVVAPLVASYRPVSCRLLDFLRKGSSSKGPQVMLVGGEGDK